MKKKYLLLILLALTFGSCQVGRFVFYNFADIKDHKKFPARELKATPGGFEFKTAEHEKKFNSVDYKGKELSFDEFLEDRNTVAFMVIRNDSIQYERYFKGYEKGSLVPSFSMAKSVTSMLIGCAIGDKLIGSVEDPVVKYVPELTAIGMEKITIRHLLQMTSGIYFNESYVNPFGHAAAYYYGRNLKKNLYKMRPESEPGKNFNYISGNTQLLGLVLERALKGKTISAYLQEKIWSPLNMEYEASWSIDRKNNGMEKTFCCINAPARDYARLGRLYLNKGNWEGRQLVPESWVKESTSPDTTQGGARFYKYQWWIPTQTGDFEAQGILGQYIYVNPEKNLIIVRLGKNEGNMNWTGLFVSIAKSY